MKCPDLDAQGRGEGGKRRDHSQHPGVYARGKKKGFVQVISPGPRFAQKECWSCSYLRPRAGGEDEYAALSCFNRGKGQRVHERGDDFWRGKKEEEEDARRPSKTSVGIGKPGEREGGRPKRLGALYWKNRRQGKKRDHDHVVITWKKEWEKGCGTPCLGEREKKQYHVFGTRKRESVSFYLLSEERKRAGKASFFTPSTGRLEEKGGPAEVSLADLAQTPKRT